MMQTVKLNVRLRFGWKPVLYVCGILHGLGFMSHQRMMRIVNCMVCARQS